MITRKIGPNGPEVSAIGLGAMSFAGIYGEASQAVSNAILESCLELGINQLDTSNVYGMGRSEDIIGKFLAEKGAASRDLFYIATKAGITKDAKITGRKFDNSRAHLEAELHGSLKRLGVDAVDLFYVHRRDPDIMIEEVTETLAGFIKAGKIHSFGFSEIAPSSLRRAAAIHPVAAVQSEYSLWTRNPELGLLQECTRLGTALVAFSPVGRGILTDTPPTAEKAAKIPFLVGNPRFMAPNLAANLHATEAFRVLAADMGTTAAGLSIAWLLAQGDPVVPIPGTRSLSHLRELAEGTKLHLSPADLSKIDEVLPVGWAHGDRYSADQWIGPERYC